LSKLKKVLFICSANKLRSPTAEHVFADVPDVETDSAGLNLSADLVLSPEQLDWADVIFVMERAHRNKLSKKYKKHLTNQRIICLNIPDDFDYMDPTLVHILKERVTPHLMS